MNSIPLPIWFEAAALLISLLCYQRLRDKPFFWFVPFLAFMVAIELIGLYMKRVAFVSNAWLYNISIPVEYFFYTYIFYTQFHFPLFKKISRVLLFAIPAAALFNMIFIQGFSNFNTNFLIAGCCLMVFQSCLFFIDLFKREIEFILLKEPMFWITTAILFFNLGELSYDLFFGYLIKHGQDKSAKLFTSINSNLVYVLYSFISIALLCIRKTSRKTSG